MLQCPGHSDMFSTGSHLTELEIVLAIKVRNYLQELNTKVYLFSRNCEHLRKKLHFLSYSDISQSLTLKVKNFPIECVTIIFLTSKFNQQSFNSLKFVELKKDLE